MAQKGSTNIGIFPSRHDIFKCSAIPDGLKGRQQPTDGRTGRTACGSREELHLQKIELAERS